MTEQKMIGTAIEPRHFEIAQSMIEASRVLGLSLHDTSLVFCAALDLLAGHTTTPGRAYENFIAIIAQIATDRGPVVKLVLDAVADIMEHEK